MKPITCKHCGVINKHHSFQCHLKPKSSDISNPKQKPIKPISDKQSLRLKQYRIVRDAYMKNHPSCEARLYNCTYVATDLHHMAGKIANLLTDVKYFTALCRSCHSYLEVHVAESKALGFTLDRLDK